MRIAIAGPGAVRSTLVAAMIMGMTLISPAQPIARAAAGTLLAWLLAAPCLFGAPGRVHAGAVARGAAT